MTGARWAAAAAAYLAVSVGLAQTRVDLTDIGRATFAGDGRLMVWVIAWFAQALRTGVPLLDAPFFYPAAGALANTDHAAGLGLVALPIVLGTGNAVAAYWTLLIAAPAATGLGTLALLRRHGLGPVGAWVGGLAAGFPFFLMLHYAHPQLTCWWGIPWGLLLLDAWWERGGAGRLAAWVAVVVWQCLVSWYVAVVCLVAIGLRVAWLGATGRDRLVARVGGLAVAAVAGAAALWPLARAYTGIEGGPAAEVRGSAADLASWLVPPERTWPGQWIEAAGIAAPRWMWGEQTLYLGAAVMVLTVLGAVQLARTPALPRARLAFFPALAVIAVALAFGPSLPGEWPRPWDAIAWLPGVSGMRAPARIGLLVPLGLAPLVGLGAEALWRRGTPASRVLLAALVAVLLLEVYVVRFPEGRAQTLPRPSVYAAAAARGARGVLALPMYVDTPGWFFDADYQLFTMPEWTPVANGLARTVPDTYRALAQATDARAMHGALRFYGIDHVVAHADRTGGSGLTPRDVLAAPGLFPVVARDGDAYLLAVAPVAP